MLWWLALAWADPRPPTSLSWALTVDGVAVGWRRVDISWADAEHRVFTGGMTLDGSALDGKLRKIRYEQALSANSQQGRPASFTASIDDGRRAREVQARRTGTTWTIVVSEDGEARTHTLPHTRVDLSTVDLLDPESERSLLGRDYARILLAETGKIEEGAVRRVGTQRVMVVDEEVEVLEWSTSEGPYRLWYAPNGWLVRWEVPLMGLRVQGVLQGEAPRATDEFPVGDPVGTIEVFNL